MAFEKQLIAHRGWRSRYPENTLIGIEAAIAAGACHVEIDIQLTADHIAVLCHDEYLTRLCGVERSIFSLTSQQLAEYSVYEPERLGNAFQGIPLSPLSKLVPMIEKHPQVSLYVEIKRESLEQYGIDTVLEAILPHLQNLRQRCYVISFDIPVLEAARHSGWPLIAPVLEHLSQLGSESMKQLAPDMIFCDNELLTDDVSDIASLYPLAVYEIDRYEQARALLNNNIALVETFTIGELITAHREAVDG